VSIVTITNRATEAVARLFGLKSNQGPRELDDGPAQAVYDLSRIAEFQSGLGGQHGFIGHRGRITHVASGDLFATFNINDIIGDHGLSPSNVSAWLINVGALEATAGATDEVLASVFYPARAAFSPGSQLYSIMHSVTFAGIATASGGSVPAVPSKFFDYPIFLPSGTVFRLASNANAAVIVDFPFLFWIGPPGGRPPGV